MFVVTGEFKGKEKNFEGKPIDFCLMIQENEVEWQVQISPVILKGLKESYQHNIETYPVAVIDCKMQTQIKTIIKYDYSLTIFSHILNNKQTIFHLAWKDLF